MYVGMYVCMVVLKWGLYPFLLTEDPKTGMHNSYLLRIMLF